MKSHELPPTEQQELPVEVARATEADFPQMLEVYRRARLVSDPNVEAGITEEDVEEDFDSVQETFVLSTWQRITKEKKVAGRIFVAKQGENVQGLIEVLRTKDLNKIESLYVDPGQHGTGVSEKLMGAALEFLPQDRPTVLEVARYNARAIRFYEKQGFVMTKQRRAVQILRNKGIEAAVMKLQPRKPK